jgi:signal transduction histidine kinase
MKWRRDQEMTDRLSVTILWVGTATDAARPASDGDTKTGPRSRPVEATAESVELGALPAAVTIAMARGGVVAAVADHSIAEQALSLGVDETMLHGASSREIERACENARLRAAARAERDGRLADELSRADGEALEILGAAVAHELKTPLAVASLNSDILCELLGPVTDVADRASAWAAAGVEISPEARQSLAALRATAPPTSEINASAQDLSTALRRATQVVRRMSALTSDEPMQSCDLAEVLSKVESIMRGLLERSAEFVVNLPGAPCLVAFPRWQLMQTMAALLANAHDATSTKARDQGVISRIEMTLTLQGAVALVEVNDTGVGMSPDVRARALHPFFTTRRPGALGLGLTIAAGRVRRAGGELMVESELGEGTRVRIFLPMSAGGAAPAPENGDWDQN